MAKDRRTFLRKFSQAAMGLFAGSFVTAGCSTGPKKIPRVGDIKPVSPGKSNVSLVKGRDRRQVVYDSLKPFEHELREGMAGKQVLIKLNCNRPSDQLVKTHPDAVRGVLDFITSFCERQIIIGESTALEVPTSETFSHYGFPLLEKEYNARLVELNDNPVTYHWILDGDLLPIQIGILDPFLDPDVYVISVTPLKTHSEVVATLSLKNVVMGAPLKNPKRGYNYKSLMHGIGKGGTSPKLINFNIFRIAHIVRPDFAVLDGVVGAEGNGPGNCTPVDHQVVLAGPDYLAVDRIGIELMGIPWEKVAYLNWCHQAGLGQGDRKKIDIIGPKPENLIIPYKLHKNIRWEYDWDRKIDWNLIHTDV